jgi:hypothetical protein
MPDQDFGAIACWYEHLFNMTHKDRVVHRLKPDVYLNLPHVGLTQGSCLMNKLLVERTEL